MVERKTISVFRSTPRKRCDAVLTQVLADDYAQDMAPSGNRSCLDSIAGKILAITHNVSEAFSPGALENVPYARVVGNPQLRQAHLILNGKTKLLHAELQSAALTRDYKSLGRKGKASLDAIAVRSKKFG